MLVLSGFVSNFQGKYKDAMNFYTKAFYEAQDQKHEFFKEICLTNLGVIPALTSVDDILDNLELEDEGLYYNCNPMETIRVKERNEEYYDDMYELNEN